MTGAPLESLFTGDGIPKVDTPHPVYEHLRDSASCRGDRQVLDAMWKHYRSHTRRAFAKNFIIDTPSRIWEMQIGCALLDLGIPIRVQDEGPDICCHIEDEVVWIEATAPTGGTDDNAVPTLASGQVGAVPDREIKLRYIDAFRKKHEKYKAYLDKGIVGRNEVKVIAISGAKVPLADMEDKPYPRIAQVLLGLGREIRAKNGATVPNTYFLDREYSDISAVLFCKNHIKNSAEVRGLEPGRDWIWIHNPLAKWRMPIGLLRVGQTYHYELQHQDWRGPLPKPWFLQRLFTAIKWKVRLWWWTRNRDPGTEEGERP